MKKLLVIICLSVLASCNTAETKVESKSGDSTKASTSSITYPYPIIYSSNFEMGDPEKSKIILDLWKDYDNNTLDNSLSKLADTITFLLPGAVMHGPKDSVMAQLKGYRGTFSVVKSDVHAVDAQKSTDKGDDWVLVWGTENHTDAKTNKTDSVFLQESWRFNKDGKADMMMQYARQPPPPMKK